MTKQARKSLYNKLILLLVTALLCVVVGMQFAYAPAFMPKSGALAGTDTADKVKISYSKAETGLVSENIALSDSGVASVVPRISTPSPSKEVTVIVSLDGKTMMDYAVENGMSVADALATVGGKNNLANLETIRDRALSSLAAYIIEKRYDYTTVLNAFSATVRYGDIAAIEKNKLVKSVMLSNTYLAPEAITENYVNVYGTGIFDSSGVGYDGTGTVVAVVDTGTDYYHEVFDMELDPATVAISKDDVAAAVPSLTATSLSASEGVFIDEDDLYIKNKLPFAYDYADNDANVYPHEAHGTHVAGIIAGKSDKITGVAPRAQIATFKVFSDYKTGAETEWILAALNDAVTLGVDAINMSLGSSCGFSREVDETEINRVYDSINAAGICLIVAASNDSSSAQNSTWGNTNLASNPDSGTVGSPGSYTAALSVGSVSGVKTRYFIAEGREVYFEESRLVGKVDANNFVEGMLKDKSEGEFDYVVIPGVGLTINYTGIDVTGKIAVVQRGTTSFEDKVRIAASRGAVGVVVYNNVSGTIRMSVGSKELIPSCFINMDLAKPIVAKGSGKIKLSADYLAGPFMSDFSSWGALPNLVLAPDITAHGGEIYSAVIGGDMYDKMSGTSMACPNLAGALILVRQYVKERYPDYSTTQIRDESYSRMMSTATIVKNDDGNPYSPRKQGAGIADIAHSINSQAYLTVDGSNKPKLSLGDDPDRTGVYKLKFNIVNTSGSAISYSLGQYVMTESISSDDRTVSEKAHLFNDTENTYELTRKKGVSNIIGNVINIGGYAEASVTVTIKLSASDKEYLNRLFVNGMYVEGYVLLESNNLDGIDLNIPYLAFYGDWSDAPMLDKSAYEIGASEADDAILPEDKLKADVYGTLPYAGFKSELSEDGLAYYGLGAYAFILPDGYTAPPTQEKYAALTANPDGNYLLYSISAGLLRCAKRVDMEIRNSATGELIWQDIDYNARKSHSGGGEQTGGYILIELDIRELDLPNNSKYTFNMTCYLDWTGDSSYVNSKGDQDVNQYVYGNKNTFSFEFTVDNEAPKVADTSIRKVKSGSSYEYFLDLSIYDNHYLQGYGVYTYSGKDGEGNFIDFMSLTGGLIPVEAEYNSTSSVSLNITGYWSTIQHKNGGQLYVTMYDYAKNETAIEINIAPEEVQKEDLQISKTYAGSQMSSYKIVPNEQIDLSAFVEVKAKVGNDYLENYWTKDLVWESSDPEVVDVSNGGIITGLKNGSSVITVRTPNLAAFDENDTLHCLKFTINVDGTPLPAIKLSGVELSSTALWLERGETVTITATYKPYNYVGDFKLTWSSNSSNVKIIAVSEDRLSAEILAFKSGSATVRASVDGNSYISGYCSVVVKQEYSISYNVYLRQYTGRGGDYTGSDGVTEHNVVEIPDDKGIVYISNNAFARNEHIKKVIIPEGVTRIMRSAFVFCTNLEEVVLPKSLEAIEKYAFAECTKLKKINLGNVKTIGNMSFIGTAIEKIDLASCTYLDDFAFLNCQNLKTFDLSRVGMIGGGAFSGCTAIETLIIPANTSMSSAQYTNGGAFSGCTSLKTVTILSNSVGIRAFSGCTSLESVIFANNVESIGMLAFADCSALKNVTFRGTVYTIDTGAFYNCTSLQSIRLPDGLTVLGGSVFSGCEALQTISVSSGAMLDSADVYSLGGVAVNEFVVEDGNKYLSAVSGVLYDRAQKKLIAYPGKKTGNSFTVPASVVTIGKSAFSGIRSLSAINLNKVEYIEDGAFYNSVYVSGLSYGGIRYTGFENVRYIGDYAFYRSAIAENLPISAKTTYIGGRSFAGLMVINASSATLAMPTDLQYLGAYAFGGVYINTSSGEELISLPYTSVSFAGSAIKSVGRGAFADNPSIATIDFGNLTELSEDMFKNTGVVSLVIPNTITTLGVGVFGECKKLTSVQLPSDLKYIPASAFYKTNLTVIALPDSVEAIGDNAFAESKLTSVNLKNVAKVGVKSFAGAPITQITADNLTEIGAGAFAKTAVSSVTMPKVVTIGDEAFSGAVELTSADFEIAKYVGVGAFAGCEKLETVSLPSVVTISDEAFSGAISLADIELPKVEFIGKKAFDQTVITSIVLPATLSKLQEGAFVGANSLTAISVDSDNAIYFADDGVLYRNADKGGYMLVGYPAGKTNAVYAVKNGTIKLAVSAFCANTHIAELTLPATLRIIGIDAMNGMTALKKITINAVDAPTLESQATLVPKETDATEQDKEPEYDFINEYRNFRFVFGATNIEDFEIIVPANAAGYNKYIWNAYVGAYVKNSNKIHISLGTLGFIDEVKAALANPNVSASVVSRLLRNYNMISTVQQQFVLGNYDYSANGNSIDKEYYTDFLGGTNYYAALQGLQNRAASTSSSFDVNDIVVVAENNGVGYAHMVTIVVALIAIIGFAVAVIIKMRCRE